jgi:hypothetical protein
LQPQKEKKILAIGPKQILSAGAAAADDDDDDEDDDDKKNV